MGARGAADEGRREAPGEPDEDEADDVVDDGGLVVLHCGWRGGCCVCGSERVGMASDLTGEGAVYR